MLIFQVICLIFIAYNIFYIIVGLDTIRNLKRKAFLNEVMGIDVRNTVISIKDKLSTFVFRIIVCGIHNNCIKISIIIMTCAIIGFIISYLFVKLTVGNSVDITGEPEFTLTEKLQASFLIFLFGGYWVVLLVKYLILLI